ncbi:hypothetical protein MRX96_009369 [Rhipicephalus microplus]
MAGSSVKIENTTGKPQKRFFDSPVTTLKKATTLPIQLQAKSYSTDLNSKKLHKTDHQKTQQAPLTPRIYAKNLPNPKCHHFA